MTDYKKEAEATTAETGAMVQYVRQLKITDEKGFQEVGSMLKDVRARADEIKEKQKAITAPMRSALDEVYSLFRPALSSLEEVEQTLKAQVADWLTTRAERERLQLQAVSEAAQAGRFTEAAAALAKIESAPTVQGISAREIVTIEVIDPSLVPDQYWVVDEKSILRMAQAAKGNIQIPGVVIHIRKSVAVRK